MPENLTMNVVHDDENPEDEKHDDFDDLEPDEVKPHCCGHRFHWAEGFFFVTTLCGVGFVAMGGEIDNQSEGIEMATYVVYLLACLTATGLMWNLVALKRLAAASEMLRTDCKKFRAENDRAKSLQEDNKVNNAKMKESLADLEKAGLLLSGSVQGLDGVRKEEEKMIEERENLLAERKLVAGELEKNMAKLWTLTIDQARQEMEKRVMDIFFDLSEPGPNDEDGISVGSEHWNTLVDIIQEYGVVFDEDSTDELGLKTLAGTDEFLNLEEFETWWTHAEEKHFTHLIAILKRNRDLEDRIRAMELGVPESEFDDPKFN